MYRRRDDARCPFDVHEVCSLQHPDSSLANGDFGIYASLNDSEASQATAMSEERIYLKSAIITTTRSHWELLLAMGSPDTVGPRTR